MTDTTVSSQSAQSRPGTGGNYLLAQVKASPGKAALLCGLTVVLIVILIRAVARPDSASATMVELAVPQESVETFESLPLPDPIVDLSSGVPAQIDNKIEPKDTTDALPQRDIFAIDLSYFEQLSDEQAQAEGLASHTDPKTALRVEVRKLRLQSTMTGPAPTAYINGILLREGNTYKGFQIRQINNRSVSLEKDGLVFNLHMAQE